MDFFAIQRFNKLTDNMVIFTCAQLYEHYNGRKYDVPAYIGPKSAWYNFYEDLAARDGWDKHLLNMILHQAISDVIVLNQPV